jgi:hypothetical protein
MNRAAHALVAACGAVLASGCAGGHSTSAALPAAAGAPAASATARFTLTIPSAAATTAGSRRPAYVSSSTLSASVAVNGGTATGVDLSAGATNCATVSGGRACTIAIPAPLGADTFTMKLYDGPLSGGLPTGNVLSAATNFAATVTEGTANITVPLVLGGIPASVDVSTGAPPTAGTPATIPLTITAYDADGNVIVGPGTYADQSGNSGIHLVINITSSQVTLHDGAQGGTLIDIAGPTDAVTLQLSAPANILGVPFIVTNPASSRLPAHTSQFVAFKGALTATLLATAISASPDYQYTGPMDSSQATGNPNGFVVSVGTESAGETLGYFDSGLESFKTCTFNTGFNLMPAAVDGGVAVMYNGAFNVLTPPEGVAFYPLSAFSGSNCASGTRYQNNDNFPKTIAYDHDNTQLLESETDNTLRSDTFSGGMFSNQTTIGSYSHTPSAIAVYDDRRAFLDADNAGDVYIQNYPSAIQALSAASTPEAVTVGADRNVYTLDSATNAVFVSSGTAASARYTSGAFGAASATLAIGPDGAAYTDDGNSTVLALAPGATSSTSASLTPPNGNTGSARGVYDGHNGYVYVFYDDGFNNSTENVYRLSY